METSTATRPLDLEPVIIKLMDEVEGEGWDFDYAKEVAGEYRNFLELCREYPDESVVPSSIVDKVWHNHILDTRKYADDCQQYFGYFLHHFPYFGMRGEADASNLDKAWQHTLSLYSRHFNKQPNKAFWPASVRCPSCGRRSSANACDEQRPSFKSFGLK